MDNLVITLSCSTVGESVSSLCVYLIFLLPSEHAQTFILNYLFLDKTISKDSASILYFLVILLVSILIKVSISWICVNSFFTAFLPFSTNIPKNNQVVLLDHDISHHVLNCSALWHGVHFGIINIDVGGDIMIVLFSKLGVYQWLVCFLWKIGYSLIVAFILIGVVMLNHHYHHHLFQHHESWHLYQHHYLLLRILWWLLVFSPLNYSLM